MKHKIRYRQFLGELQKLIEEQPSCGIIAYGGGKRYDMPVYSDALREGPVFAYARHFTLESPNYECSKTVYAWARKMEQKYSNIACQRGYITGSDIYVFLTDKSIDTVFQERWDR